MFLRSTGAFMGCFKVGCTAFYVGLLDNKAGPLLETILWPDVTAQEGYSSGDTSRKLNRLFLNEGAASGEGV